METGVTGNGVSTGWIVFDVVEIDCAGRRLFVAGSEMPLEPKAFAVLHLLASKPGQAFTRDDILDAVWGHRHVTPGVLNRVVTLIRHALGESADEHRYLHTLHGIGYRFDATVRQFAARAGVEQCAENSAVSILPIPSSDSSAPTSIEVSAAETAPPPPGEVAAPLARAPASGSAHLDVRSSTRMHAGRWLGFAAALFGIAAAVAYFGLRHPPSATTVPPALVVLPLRPVGGTPDDTVLAEGLSEELITRLAHIEGLRLISRTSAARAQEDKLDLNQLSERLHVTHALEGSLRQSDDQLRIDLRLIDIPAGRTLWAQDYDRKLADVFAIQHEIAQAVAQVLTLKLGAANAAAEAEVDPQWFREYLELRHMMGDAKYLNAYLTAHTQFVDRLRALVVRAPGYARAHGLLARALVQDLRPVDISEDERADAAKEAAIALQLDPNQIEAHAALASIAGRTDDWSRCLDEYRLVLKLDPTDSTMRAAYAARLAYIGYIDEALQQIQIAWNSDPLSPESSLLYPWLTDVKGRHDEARLLFEAIPQQTDLRWFNAVWRRDFAAAHDLAASMPASSKYTDSYVAASEALLDPMRWSLVQPRIQGSFAGLAQPDLDREASMRMIEALWTRHTTPLPAMLWVPELANVHSSAAFQDFLQRRHILGYWRSHGFPLQCKAEGDGARCD